MSEELLEHFINSVNEEDGIFKKEKKKVSASDKRKHAVKRILSAASRGQVELPPDEEFLVEKVDKKKKKTKNSQIDDKLAAQGFSLVEQVRAERPDDLLKRNIKYMKYSQKRKLDVTKSGKIIDEHMRSLVNKAGVRKERERITCLRDPKKIVGKKKGKSVFSDKDFQLGGGKKKRSQCKQTEDGTFI